MRKLRHLISSIFRPFRNWRRQRFFAKKYGIITEDVVIFSNNCLGGITYHDANREFLSPTINLLIENNFFTFVKNFDFYSKTEITQIESSAHYPQGVLKGNNLLPDIKISFVHYKTFIEGKRAWQKRAKRFSDKYPIYIIYCTKRIENSDIKMLGNIKYKKAILICYETEPNIKILEPKISLFKVPFKYQNMDYSSYKHLLGRKRYFDDFVDLIKIIYK